MNAWGRALLDTARHVLGRWWQAPCRALLWLRDRLALGLAKRELRWTG